MSVPVICSVPRCVRLSLFAAIVLITCACAPQGNVRAPVAAPDPLVLANRQLNNGNYNAAANAYLSLAASADGSAAYRLRAQAALAYQDAGDSDSAAAVLADIPEGAAGASELVNIAAACAMNAAGQFEASLTRLRAVDTVRLTPYQRGRHSRCLGRAALETEHNAEAATALTEAWQFPVPAGYADTLAQNTWRALARLPEAELLPQTNALSATTAGWYNLALIAARSMFDTARFIEQSDAWALKYPQHPAYVLLEELVERSEAIAVLPRKIALVLPFSDNLDAAATAIRDGFLSAWYLDSRHASRPQIAVYSSAGDDIEAVFNTALAEGAEFVVGPLQKQLVERIRSNADLNTNVLALNVTDNAAAGSRAGFYQFGLTPEDEAGEVAKRALTRGQRALVLAPESTWGHRLAGAYQHSWRSYGAEVVREIYYDEDPQAYAAAVKQALSIGASEARNAELRRVLNLPLHFEPRRRADIDVILLAGFPENARQIMPQLRYFNAGKIPVFSTSHVFAGAGSDGRDTDLDGITFADMPWLFGTADHDSYNFVRRHWGSRVRGYARLYALGIDAYRIVPHLAKMRFQPTLRVPGVSGSLWMDNKGIVHRRLSFAQFIDGAPTPLDVESVRRAR